MKSTAPNTDDVIEVLDGNMLPFGRIRIRERQGNDYKKCSIYLTPDQLEEHARECLTLATSIRKRQPH